jgi:pentatricopeptide repeat protein
LVQKCHILAQGYAKRGKSEEAKHYHELMRKYSNPAR